jgi:hypothetical protein
MRPIQGDDDGLLLGLVTASARSAFDSRRRAEDQRVEHPHARPAARTLRSETAPARETIRKIAFGSRRRGNDRSPGSGSTTVATPALEEIETLIRS